MYSHLSVFDLDHTLLTVNSSYCFGSFLFRRHSLSRLSLCRCLIDYMRHKVFRFPMDYMHQKAFEHLFKGVSRDTIEGLVQQFIQEKLSKILYHPAIQRLKDAQLANHYTIILSSSPDFLVKSIASALHVHEWSSTIYGCDENGYFDRISSMMEGQDKANYMQKLAHQLNIPLSSVTVYSDSYLDLPVLEMAGKAVGVTPDTYLRQHCLKNRWEIL